MTIGPGEKWQKNIQKEYFYPMYFIETGFFIYPDIQRVLKRCD